LFRCVDLQCDPDDFVPTVSGLCFSKNDRHLAASTWIPRKRHAPTLYFEASGLTLTHRTTVEHGSESSWPNPTGILLCGKYTITRNSKASAPDRRFAVHESPRELGIEADDIRQHLTSSNFVVVRSSAITPGRGLSVVGTYEDQWRTIIEFRESGRAVDEGLVTVILDGQSPSCETIAVRACRQVTAIAATPDGNGFVTGGLEGELDRWSWEGRWRQERLREWTYDSKSVVAICHLSRGHYWVSASGRGEIDLIAEGVPVGSWQLPRLSEPGSMCALAAHPTQNWIAIGITQGQLGNERGVVDLVEMESPIRPI
jgi:hypothetical protein